MPWLAITGRKPLALGSLGTGAGESSMQCQAQTALAAAPGKR